MLSISNPVCNPLLWLGRDREERKGGREEGTGRNERDKLRVVLETRKKFVPERNSLAG